MTKDLKYESFWDCSNHQQDESSTGYYCAKQPKFPWKGTTKMTWMSDLKLCNRLLCSSNLLSTRIYGRLCRRAPPKQMLRLMTFQMSKVHRRTRMKRMCHHRLNMLSLNPRSSKKRLGSDLLQTRSLTNNLFRASCPQTWRQWTLTFKSIQQISRITLKT